MTEPATHWGIVGGGLLGLTLAHRLRKLGYAVTVLEAAPQFGGLAAAWKLGEVTWDKHYHVILLSDSRLRNLLLELELESELEWVQTKTGFYTDGRMYSMSNSWEFLKFPPLGLIDKFRLGLTIFHASRVKDWKALEKIPVVEWLLRWSGRHTTEKIWLPLLRAKLGESYPQASAAFLWAIIARMYAARRSGLKKEMFGYVRGGYARILDRFVQRLEESGVSLRPNSPVNSITSESGVVRVECRDGNSLHFDRVIVTAAAPLAKKLCPDLSDAEKKLLDGVSYQGIVCASLLLKKPLDRYYVTNITETWVPFTAVIEMTALVNPETFGGKTLVYLPKYVAPDDPIFRESDDSIRERFVSALERIYPHFRRDDVLAFQLSRVRHVFAISTLHYSDNLPPMATSLPGISLVNSAHIVNGTLNVNETVQLAETALDQILAAQPRETVEAIP
jgi:protoporphyrinogen oxidase